MTDDAKRITDIAMAALEAACSAIVREVIERSDRPGQIHIRTALIAASLVAGGMMEEVIRISAAAGHPMTSQDIANGLASIRAVTEETCARLTAAYVTGRPH